jgi:hypothetical protein
MALYVPAGRRRRQAITAAVVGVVAGLLIGALVGRLTVPSMGDRVDSVHADVEETVAGLRVIALHDEAGAVGSETGGGADLVLDRTREELRDEFDAAPWLAREQLDALLGQLNDLVTLDREGGDGFGAAAEAMAVAIEETFGLN